MLPSSVGNISLPSGGLPPAGAPGGSDGPRSRGGQQRGPAQEDPRPPRSNEGHPGAEHAEPGPRTPEPLPLSYFAPLNLDAWLCGDLPLPARSLESRLHSFFQFIFFFFCAEKADI